MNSFFSKRGVFAIAVIAFVIFVSGFSSDNRDKFSFVNDTPRAEAGDAENVSGFAWSSNIGWISFNCKDSSGASALDSCASGPYGVDIDDTTGYFSGYAWSSNIGWINTSPSPEATGSGCTSGNCAIRITDMTQTSGNVPVTGWARACSVFLAGCDGALKSNILRGDWDGWIKMSGSWANGVYLEKDHEIVTKNGVTYDEHNHLRGFAWGGDVMGWIDFDPSTSIGPCFSCGAPEIRVSTIPLVGFSGASDSINIVSGNDVYVYWDAPIPAGCSAIGGSGWVGTPITNSGMQQATRPLGDVSFTIDCGSNGLDTAFVYMSAGPDFNISVAPQEHQNLPRVGGVGAKVSLLNVVPQGGFSSDVSLTVESVFGFKNGVRVTGDVKGNGANRIRVDVADGTLSQAEFATGSNITMTIGGNVVTNNTIDYYEVTVKGTSGGVERTATIKLRFTRNAIFQEN